MPSRTRTMGGSVLHDPKMSDGSSVFFWVRISGKMEVLEEIIKKIKAEHMKMNRNNVENVVNY